MGTQTAPTALAEPHRRRLTTIRQREDEGFKARIPRSLAMDTRAREVMPNGVPMAWMAGLFRTPPIWAAHGRGASFTDIDANSHLDSTSATCPQCWATRTRG